MPGLSPGSEAGLVATGSPTDVGHLLSYLTSCPPVQASHTQGAAAPAAKVPGAGIADLGAAHSAHTQPGVLELQTQGEDVLLLPPARFLLALLSRPGVHVAFPIIDLVHPHPHL